jgi:putative transposase
MIAHRESAELAEKFIEQTIGKHGIAPGQLSLHADRGRVMRSKPVAFLLADLGVTKTHSRPYVSDDNPYSESQFRTMKYRPEFRIGSAVSRTLALSARCSSLGTTTNTVTRDSACSRLPWCTSARHRSFWQAARLSSMPPTTLIRNASFGKDRNLCRSPRRFGSTNRLQPVKRQRTKVTKFLCQVPQSC